MFILQIVITLLSVLLELRKLTDAKSKGKENISLLSVSDGCNGCLVVLVSRVEVGA